MKKVKVSRGGDSSIIINEPIDRLILCLAGECKGICIENMRLKWIRPIEGRWAHEAGTGSIVRWERDGACDSFALLSSLPCRGFSPCIGCSINDGCLAWLAALLFSFLWISLSLWPRKASKACLSYCLCVLSSAHEWWDFSFFLRELDRFANFYWTASASWKWSLW